MLNFFVYELNSKIFKRIKWILIVKNTTTITNGQPKQQKGKEQRNQ